MDVSHNGASAEMFALAKLNLRSEMNQGYECLGRSVDQDTRRVPVGRPAVMVDRMRVAFPRHFEVCMLGMPLTHKTAVK
jgi:hypothetical protein